MNSFSWIKEVLINGSCRAQHKLSRAKDPLSVSEKPLGAAGCPAMDLPSLGCMLWRFGFLCTASRAPEVMRCWEAMRGAEGPHEGRRGGLSVKPMLCACVWLSAVPLGLIAQCDGGGTAQLCSLPSAVALQAAVCAGVRNVLRQQCSCDGKSLAVLFPTGHGKSLQANSLFAHLRLVQC